MKYKIGDMFLTPRGEIFKITSIIGNEYKCGSAWGADGDEWLSNECVQVKRVVFARIIGTNFDGYWIINDDDTYLPNETVIVESKNLSVGAKVIGTMFVSTDFKHGHKKVLGRFNTQISTSTEGE